MPGFGGSPQRNFRKAPPEFEWVSIQMDITRWAIVTSLTLIGLGVWTGTWRLNDLTHKVNSTIEDHAKGDATNIRQDADIASLKNTLTKHQVYLERILDAVRKPLTP